MKPIRVEINCFKEAKRIFVSKQFDSPVRSRDIYDCIMIGGITLTGDGRLALINPFEINQQSIFPYTILCGGEIVKFGEDEEQPARGVVVIDFTPSRRIAQMFNLSLMKTVNIKINEYTIANDKNGRFTRIKNASLVPNLDELKITEPNELNRKLQPSVMSI